MACVASAGEAGESAMKLENIPIAAIDWSGASPIVQAGETGTATARTQERGQIRLRVVEYSGGYEADHWCVKGHIIYVIAGSLVIEYEDQTRSALKAGMSWHAADGARPAHRVLCESGATVFIVD
jgi:quercetin dioxygenase-like cupin family protein